MNKYNDELLEAVNEIAEIIYMELPLEYQDVWLMSIIDKGMWKPTLEMDVTRVENGSE
jgi:hypothetical protein|tara:strand:+ start:106 stop:279 length:174 start_codon:yes stop_codon:yes gene_type:complete